jgi:hypothetical protein
MTTFSKNYKKLCKAYDKRLLVIHKESFEQFDTPLRYFVTYLQFLRDKCLLESPLTEKLGSDNLKLTSLVAALTEFDNYQNCIYNYYQVNGETVTHLDKFTAETAAAEFQKEKQVHWEAFWNLTMLCIEEWGDDAEL